ncbi:DUF475 domain-containing protein [Salipiger mucosus]|uniref:DUF475 domain-containing protein n=1 Tax=Salipiger mucosus TaxID=263378 RepID=UPI00036167D9|nr:DUF475 domain-containing protein [Salipiger mucosus]
MSTETIRRTGEPMIHHLRWAFAVTVLGLVLGAVDCRNATGTASGILTLFFTCAVLIVLEISLSFDNANKIKSISPKWQGRFLTWDILIADFGMRSRSCISPRMGGVAMSGLALRSSIRRNHVLPAQGHGRAHNV